MLRGLAVALVLAGAGAAQAQPTKPERDRAAELYREGLEFFKKGDYDGAIERFKESYVLSNAPLLLFNLGQAYRLKGECAEARVHYENYLKREHRLHSREGIEESLKECEERSRNKQPEPQTQTQTQTQERATGDGRPEVEQATGDRRQATGDRRPGEETETVAIEPPPRPGARKKLIGIGVGGAGVVLTVVGIVFGARAAADKSDLEDRGGEEWTPELEELSDRQRRNATLAPIFIAAGVAGIAGGAVLFYLGHREAREGEALAAVPTDGGGVMVWSTRF